jgi:transposase
LIPRQKSVWASTRWGEKTRTDSEGEVTKGWDHDPPAKEKLVPFGILILATGALTLLFGSHETSDFWGDCLRAWWKRVRHKFRQVRRLVIYLDNGPKNSGRRTQFLKRLVEFADWSGLEIRLVYYPPYHSKYNPIERCWSSLQKKWNGVLLTRTLQKSSADSVVSASPSSNFINIRSWARTTILKGLCQQRTARPMARLKGEILL